MELEVVYRDISMLNPYEHNSRNHSQTQIIQLQKSITEFGFTNPILLDPEGTIIAGHARLEAATRLGMEKVPTITLEGLSDEHIRAYVIADNKLAMNASWNEDVLKSEVLKLDIADFDLDLLGFDGLELANIMDLEIKKVDLPGSGDDEPEKKVYRTIKVQFECESDVQTFAELLRRKIAGDVRAFWFPIETDAAETETDSTEIETDMAESEPNAADFDTNAFEIPEDEL